MAKVTAAILFLLGMHLVNFMYVLTQDYVVYDLEEDLSSSMPQDILYL